MAELTDMAIGEAGARIHAREVSPLELTEAYLRRIERLNPLINAYITITGKRALDEARRATDELVAGRDRGPLHGIPIGLKDLYQTKGVRTTAGSKILADWVPDADSTVTRKLTEAGCVLLGKLNTHEFAWGVTTDNPHYGPTRNPWNTKRIPGGSSGGSGAAIAASLACGTMGTDTGGSIRIPAALCGCVGLKPTFGRVSKAGVVPMSWQFDHAGPITRTVRDAAIMLGAVAGYDPADFATVPVPVPDYTAGLEAGVKGLRVGVLRGYFSQLVDAEVAASFETAAGVLRSLGADVRDLDIGMSLEVMMEAWGLVNAETQAYHAGSIGTRLQDFGQDLQAILTAPLPDALGLARAYRASYDVKELFRRTFEEHDLLIAPGTRVTATEIGQQTVTIQGAELPVSMAMAGLTMPFNIAGLPALSLPCGFSGTGMPIAMQIAGRPFDEATVLRAGRAYEQATEWHLKRPELPA